MEHKRVLNVLDRMAHDSTTQHDLEQSAAAMRRLLKGKLPSEVFAKNAPAAPYRSYDACQAEIDELKTKLSEVKNQSATSERERDRQIKRLIAEIVTLQSRLDRSTAKVQQQDYYSYDEVIQVMVRKFKKHHGVPAALVERNRHLVQQDGTVGRITASAMQQWRKADRYPRYVVEQISAMTPGDILQRGKKWTDDERRFLAQLYSANPQRSNQLLADACSSRFGRLITECSIKGELNRLRQNGRVSQYRAIT